MTRGAGLRTASKEAENTPDPKEGAPVLDPTGILLGLSGNHGRAEDNAFHIY